MLASKLFSSIGNTDRLYVDDVFSAYTYTGNGPTQTINNGIDLAGKGGMVWFKRRDTEIDHWLIDTVRGPTKQLGSNLTYEVTTSNILTFGSSGYQLLNGQGETNANSYSYISWAFRKAPKFFDVVTYTGNGANRTISHALGQEVGMIYVKRTGTAGDWQVYHRSIANTEYMVLNSTAAKVTGATRWNSTTPTTSAFSLGTDATVNASGGTYVAYLFAHDTSDDGIVQCGSFTGMPSSIVLGWEPQYLMIKCTDSTNDWSIYDTARNWASSSAEDSKLKANISNAEQSIDDFGEPNATGFNFRNEASGTYIYLAIRRPNKPPTTGTEVYNAIAFAGNSTGSTKQTLATSFPPDAVLLRNYLSYSSNIKMYDRLRGDGKRLSTNLSNAQTPGSAAFCSFTSNMQFTVGPDSEDNPGYSGGESVAWAFKRAPGFFDVVCSQSTPSGELTFSHGLGVVPELIIHKDSGYATDWDVWTTAFGGKHYLKLNSTSAATSVSHPSTLTATTVFSGSGSQTGNSPQVCYLFASLPGISKVGSYTGNGSSQTINCGFSTGARFILIKRTDSTGDWYVWSTARGIIAANDPHLSLNTTSAEVTTNDSVDPNSTGFIVNQVAATNINVNGATYLYLAIA